MPDTGELPDVEYEIDFDGDWAHDWIFVPTVFPNERWPDPESWASDMAARTFEKGSADQRWFREMARILATDPLPEDVDLLLWYAPWDGSAHGFVNVTFADPDSEVNDAESWAVAGIDQSETPVQVTRYPSEKYGEIVQAALTFRADEQTLVGNICTVAIGQTAVFYLTTTSADFRLLARMQPELVRLVDGMCEVPVEGEGEGGDGDG